MTARLQGKVALVSGAGQGIGRGIARALAAEGADVCLAGRTLAKVEKVAAEIAESGGSALAVRCDVADRTQVDVAVVTAVERFGGLDVLVNNAQTTAPNRRLQDVPIEDVEVCWSTGPVGSLHAMQAAFPHLCERGGGSIVNLGSNTGVDGSPLFGPYAMAKEAIRGLTKVAAREWGRFGIRVNVICPFGDSPSAQEFQRDHPEAAAAILRSTPLGRVGNCEADIGRAVVGLVSDDFSYLTGATLMLDGGLCILR
ncbi:MAG TPA: SDR family oxidoreductase [Acidimicrobiales bacterium]|jgi:NAD(P)-dependent dehydrogenase (short-subunit alcohol dehydrogenase family)|nr:SDR family oxidoreductase [Acidimicrobiales bacterium]